MSAKNVLQKHWNGSAWEELHPVTKASNVFFDNQVFSLQEYFILGSGGIFTQASGMSIPVNIMPKLSFTPSETTSIDCQGEDFIVKRPGVYIINIHPYIASSVADGTNILIQIDRNGANLINKRTKHAPNSGDSWSVYQLSYVQHLNAGDVISFRLRHSFASAVNSQFSRAVFSFIGLGGI